jgi:hypothetical protein
MIDSATGWFEIVVATNMLATSIQDLFHNTWLARYLRPQFIVFENRNNRKIKIEFKQMCDNFGINAKSTTSHNPLANAIMEQVHKDVLRRVQSILLFFPINCMGY